MIPSTFEKPRVVFGGLEFTGLDEIQRMVDLFKKTGEGNIKSY